MEEGLGERRRLEVQTHPAVVIGAWPVEAVDRISDVWPTHRVGMCCCGVAIGGEEERSRDTISCKLSCSSRIALLCARAR